MSAAPASKSGAPFLWVLGAFTSFAILLAVLLNLAEPAPLDPREPERLANKEEITKAQKEILSNLGLSDPNSKSAIFDKTLTFLATRKPAASTQVVPGSPTQLKQAAASSAPAPEPAKN
jgi:hypothetical protein